METGYRTGPDGALVPRDIIRRFVCTYNGEEVFSADLFPAISANPFLVLLHRRDGERHHRDSAGRTTTARRQIETAAIAVEP